MYSPVSTPESDFDIESAFRWYESEEPGLGLEFLAELRATYERICDQPNGYEELRSNIRRALTRRFPYAVYFAIEDDAIVILAVLHVARNPAEWQKRR